MTAIDRVRVMLGTGLAAGIGLAGGDPHLAAFLASARALSAEESEAQQRLIRRRMLGCCPCGLAPGEDRCPVCDDGLPAVFFHPGPKEIAETLAKLAEAHVKRRVPEPERRPMNRQERRAERSRRRRG